MTGRAVKELLLKNFLGQGFGLEIFYAFVIIVCSLMIYFGTRELYKLSGHKGIGYFRLAFLFFALAHFSRIFIRFILSYGGVAQILDVSHRVLSGLIALISLPFFIYFSAMAVFCLVYSVAWKKLDRKKIGPGIFHVIAGVLALASLIFRDPLFYLILNIVFFLVVLGVVYLARGHGRKKRHSLYLVYFLLLIFWIFNIIDIMVPNFVRGFQLLIYLISTGIFLVILYRVLRRVGVS